MTRPTTSQLSVLQLNINEGSISGSVLDGSFTPTTASEQAFEDDSTDSLIARWQEAQEACREELRDSEWEIISKFKTPEDLEADLRRRHSAAANSYQSRMIRQMYPCLSLIKDLSALFLRSLPGGRVETGLFWGIFHLAIKSSLESIDTLAKIVKMLTQIETNLLVFKRYARNLETSQEMRRALVGVLVALIRLWIRVVRNLGRGAAWSPQINHQFTLVIEELKGAVELVNQIATFEKAGIDPERQRRLEADIIEMVSLDETANVRWPTDKIPESNENFYSRVSELNAISAFFTSANSYLGLRTYVLYAIGGMGKTAVAQAFAHLCKSKPTYDGIFWLKSQTAAECKASFADIAIHLDLPTASKTGNHEHNVFLVKHWFKVTSKKWLLIYDNVENFALLADYLPHGAGDILVTTRYRWVAKGVKGKTCIAELEPLSLSDSITLFNRIRTFYSDEPTPAREMEAIEAIVKDLGGLPLGIEQIAAYIGTNGFSISTFSAKYKKMALRIYKEMNHGKEDGFILTHTLHTVWQMSFDQISGTDASKLLGILSMLNPDEILYELLLIDSFDAINSFADFCKDEARVDDALKILNNFALIKNFGGRITIHRLVQKAYLYTDKGLRPAELQAAFDSAVYLVDKQFPKLKGYGLFSRWKQCAAYFPHAMSLVTLYQNAMPIAFCIPPEMETLMVGCTWYQYEIGEVKNSLDLIETAREMCANKEGLLYSQLCNTAGVIHYEYNDLIRCRENHEKCLSIRKRLLTGANPNLANTYGNVGNLLLSEGRLDEALVEYQNSEDIRSQAEGEAIIYLGLNHLTTGRVHFLKKDFQTARSYYDKARRIFKDSGNENSWLMGSLSYDEGNLHIAENDLLAAEASFKFAFDIQHGLAPRQIGTAACYFKRALASYLLKRYAEALTLIEKALVIARYRRFIGEEARMLYLKATIMSESPASTLQCLEEAEATRELAQRLRTKFVNEIARGVEPTGNTEAEKYNKLVCGYLR